MPRLDDYELPQYPPGGKPSSEDLNVDDGKLLGDEYTRDRRGISLGNNRLDSGDSARPPIIYGRVMTRPIIYAVGAKKTSSALAYIGVWGLGPMHSILHVDEVGTNYSAPSPELGLAAIDTVMGEKGDYLTGAHWPPEEKVGNPDAIIWRDSALKHDGGHRLAATYYETIPDDPSRAVNPPPPKAMVYGRKIYDPRDSTQLLDDPATWRWSNNAALVLADFYSNPTYGMGRTVLWSSVVIAANYCDNYAVGADGKPARLTANVKLERLRRSSSVAEELRGHANVLISTEGGVVRFVPDEAGGHSGIHVSANEDLLASQNRRPSEEIRFNPTGNVPTSTSISYITNSVTGNLISIEERTAELDGGQVINGFSPQFGGERSSTMNLRGLESQEAAETLAGERLAQAILNRLEVTFTAFDDKQLAIGDVFTYETEQLGTSAELRVLGKVTTFNGTTTYTCAQHTAGAYGQVTPSNDGSSGGEGVTPPPTSLFIDESSRQDTAGANRPFLKLQWAPPTGVSSAGLSYLVTVEQRGTVVYQTETSSHSVDTTTVEAGVQALITIEVVALDSDRTIPLQRIYTPTPPVAPPPAPPVLYAAAGPNGESFTWEAPKDTDGTARKDIARYELRVYEDGSAVGGWAGGTTIAVTDALETTANLPGEDTEWVIMIKSINQEGIPSLDYASATVRLVPGLGDGAKRLELAHKHAPGTVHVGMRTVEIERYHPVEETDYPGSLASLQFPATPVASGNYPNPADTYRNPDATPGQYETQLLYEWTAQGQEVSGQATVATTPIPAGSGVPATAFHVVSTEADGSTVDLPFGGSVYTAPVKLEGTLAFDPAVYTLLIDMGTKAHVDIVPIFFEEHSEGPVSVPAAGLQVTTKQTFNTVTAATAVAYGAPVDVTARIGGLTIDTNGKAAFTLLLVDGAGNQVAGSASWSISGF